jgi:hypothetical protein
MIQDGVSPEIGTFKIGEDRLVSKEFGELYIKRGIATEIKVKNPAPKAEKGGK